MPKFLTGPFIIELIVNSYGYLRAILRCPKLFIVVSGLDMRILAYCPGYPKSGWDCRGRGSKLTAWARFKHALIRESAGKIRQRYMVDGT